MQAKMWWLWSESPWVYTQGMCTARRRGVLYVIHHSFPLLPSQPHVQQRDFIGNQELQGPTSGTELWVLGYFKGVESILPDKTAGIVCTVDNLLMLQWKCANTQGCNFGELLWGLRAIPYLRNSPPARKLNYSLIGRILSYYFPSQTSAILSCDVLCTSPNFSAPPGACKSWNTIPIAAPWQG